VIDQRFHCRAFGSKHMRATSLWRYHITSPPTYFFNFGIHAVISSALQLMTKMDSPLPRITIKFCVQCNSLVLCYVNPTHKLIGKWNLRAAYVSTVHLFCYSFDSCQLPPHNSDQCPVSEGINMFPLGFIGDECT